MKTTRDYKKIRLSQNDSTDDFEVKKLDGTTALKVDGAGALDVSGLVSSKTPYIHYVSGLNMPIDQDTFLGIGSVASATNADYGTRRFLAPFDGYVRKLVIKDSKPLGDIDAKLWKAGILNAADDVDQTQLGATVSTTIAHTVNSVRTFNFGSSYSFVAGEMLAVSLDPETVGGDLDGTLVVVYDNH